MKFEVELWRIPELYKRRNRINFPVYQRSLVWSERQRRLLIDSILRGIDIPKLYLQYFNDKEYEEWDCIDGHQRIQTILDFLDGESFETLSRKDLTGDEEETIEKYELTVAKITEISPEEVRLLFNRLQLGTPLNSGEKLNAIISNMGNFVKDMLAEPFIKNVNVPERRFAKLQVCAQICNNSAYINRTGDFRNSKYEDLENLYREQSDFDLGSYEAKQIMHILDSLDSIFSYRASEITNRASVVSVFLLVEEKIIEDPSFAGDTRIRDFYLRFSEELRKEVRAGIDATSHFLITYNSRIIQAADSKSSIGYRHDTLKEAFQYYLETGKIMR